MPYRKGMQDVADSVVMATAATLRRNVKNRNFLSTFDPDEREGFVKSLTDAAAAAFKELGVAHSVLDGVPDTESAVVYDSIQAEGLVPEMPLPLSERIGFVFDSPDVVGGFLKHSMAVTCGVEDHLQIRSVVPGLDPEAAWKAVDRLDTAINAHVDYAFRRDIGYLTADPARAGSTLELAAYVFPIGLDIDNKADEVMHEMRSRGCDFAESGMVPGIFSGLCKVVSRSGKNRKELSVARTFRRTIDELIEREMESRDDLEYENGAFITDAFSRDLAILKNAYAISADEAIAKLWTVKNGFAMGYLKGKCGTPASDLIGVMRSPAYATTIGFGALKSWDSLRMLFSDDEEERDEIEDEIDTYRAAFLRNILSGIKTAG